MMLAILYRWFRVFHTDFGDVHLMCAPAGYMCISLVAGHALVCLVTPVP